MAATAWSKIASLVLRVVTFVLLFISFLILVTITTTVGDTKFRFNDLNANRFVAATIIIGAAFSLLQIAFSLYHLVRKSEGSVLFYFYGDKVLSYVLLAGSAVGLSAGVESKSTMRSWLGNGVLDSYFDKGTSAAALVMVAFVCSAVVSVLSSLALTKTA